VNNQMYFPCEDDCYVSEMRNVVQKIWEKLGDEKSKILFKNRLLYSLTKDFKFMREVLDEAGVTERFKEYLQDDKSNLFFCYGAGIRGTRLVNIFRDINWVGYIDKNKKGIYNELPVFDIETVVNATFSKIIVSNLENTDLIKNELIEKGISKDSIVVLAEIDKIIGYNQYFENEFMLSACDFNRCFVDIGCYDGSDTIKYLEWCNVSNASVIGFEADRYNYALCKEKLEKYDNVELYNYGLSDKEGIGLFQMLGAKNSKFTSTGTEEVALKRLDDVLAKRQVGFVKMDIEGFEEKCLQGARRIISEQRPVLAISIYHKGEDIWKIPLMVLEMNKGYRFYLRHYNVGVQDTVLYAIPE